MSLHFLVRERRGRQIAASFPQYTGHFKPLFNKEITALTLLFHLQFLSISGLRPQIHTEDMQYIFISGVPCGVTAV